jgi:hypothetical protein
MNNKIKTMAPVLNLPSLKWTFNPKTDTMLKQGTDGALYVFAMGAKGATGSVEFTVPPGSPTSKVEALFENRVLPFSGGKFTDTFAAENSYHIYKIT